MIDKNIWQRLFAGKNKVERATLLSGFITKMWALPVEEAKISPVFSLQLENDPTIDNLLNGRPEGEEVLSAWIRHSGIPCMEKIVKALEWLYQESNMIVPGVVMLYVKAGQFMDWLVNWEKRSYVRTHIAGREELFDEFYLYCITPEILKNEGRRPY